MIHLAQHGGAWLQRVDSGDKDAKEFRAEVAEQFGFDPETITVLSRSGTSDDAIDINAALGSGTFEGVVVTKAPALPAPPPSALHAAIDKALTSKSTDDILSALAEIKARV